MLKRIASCCIAILLVISMLQPFALYADAAPIASGECGENLTWELDDKGLLTISGTGEMYDFDYTGGYWEDVFGGLISKVVVSEGVTSIGKSAFHNCDTLVDAIIPDSVTSIGESAFYSCGSLKNVQMPKEISYIGRFAFHDCGQLTNIIIPSGITEIPQVSFTYCRGLNNVTIPNGVQVIEYGAFQACTELTCVVLPKSVQTIDEAAFAFCSNIRDVYYAGTEAQWNAISIGEFNEELVQATIHYNSTVSDNEGFSGEMSNRDDCYGLYATVVENRITAYNYASLSEVYKEGCRGLLYDINNDGQEELILQYRKDHSWKYEVWTVRDGEVVSLLDVTVFSTMGVAEVSLAIFEDNEYIVIESCSAGSGGDYQEWLFYLVSDNSYQKTYSLAVSRFWDDGITEEGYFVNESSVSEKEFDKFYGCLEQETVIPIQEDGVMLQELLEFLRNQTGGGDELDNIDYEMNQVSTTNGFNTYFVDNYYSNILRLSLYESAAKGIVECSTNFQINWNTYLSGLSDKNFVDLSKVSVNPHYYYEIALLEAIMQTKLNDDYLSSLTSQVGSLTIDALSFYVKYDANFNNYEDILKTRLKDSMPYFRTDSSEFLRIKDYYGQYCRQLDNYEVVKDIYDMTTEMDGSVEDFFNALSSYAGVRQASNEILSALKYLRSDLEKSSVEEDRLILKAVNNLILAFESDLDRQLVINTLKTTQDQLWNVFYSAMGIAFDDLDLTLTVADFSIDTALTLSNVIFPTTISSTSYCKIYADFAIETVVQRAMLSAYDEYLISPSQGLADSIIGMYDLLGYTYSHEIEVASVLSEQLHKDGLINGLKNVFSGRNAKAYEYEQECIRAYNAYLKDIQKVKVEALEAYGLAVGRLQPVVTVYFVNGKVVAVNEVSIETGTLYDVSSGGLKLPEFTNLYVEIGGYYTNEAMTILYNESEVVNGPITLYCDLFLLKQSDGTPVLFDHSTGISVTRNEEGNHTVLNTSKITDGEHYESVKEYFRGKKIDLYDISLVQGGSTIQPQGEVVVEIPVDGEHTYKKLRVYRIEADGTYTDMDATYDNQTCRFTTAHFSSYVVVYENAVSMWGIVLIAVIAVCCATVIGVYLVKRKKK